MLSGSSQDKEKSDKKKIDWLQMDRSDIRDIIQKSLWFMNLSLMKLYIILTNSHRSIS